MASRGATQTRQQTRVVPRASEPVVDAVARHDITGLFIAVVAAALAVALMTNSSALVPSAVSQALRLAFGAGAILVPVALGLFSATFFAPTDKPISTRLAIGMFLIVIAMLALLSITVPGVELFPEKALESEAAISHGGYVGASIAWALLVLFGKLIGIIFLAGIIVTGIIICGFSISDLVERVSNRANAVATHATERRRERAEMRRQQRVTEYSEPVVAEQAPRGRRMRPQPAGNDASYLGGRETSVLRRQQVEEQEPPARRGLFGFGLKRLFVADDFDDEFYDEYDEYEASNDKPSGLIDIPERDARPASRRNPADPEGALPTRVMTRKRKPKVEVVEEERGSVEPEGSEVPANDAYDLSQEVKIATVPEFLSRDKKVGGSTKPPLADEGDSDQVLLPWEDEPTPKKKRRTSKRQGAAKEPVANKPAASLNRSEGTDDDYAFPPANLIETSPENQGEADDSEVSEMAMRLQDALQKFGSRSTVVGYVQGPNVTTFRVAMGEGERVSKVTGLENDLALALASRSVRIFTIPSTSYLGIEIPNRIVESVRLGDVLPFVKGGPLDTAFGRDSEGQPVVVDLAGLPHLLVAGTTGSGKSVFLNGLIMSILMRATPEEVRFIMVDPKRVEFSFYAGLPHLYVPVVTEPRQATSALQWAVTEMERRLKVFEHYKVRDIKSYNKQVKDGDLAQMENPPKHMPYFVIVIDELADLMMVAGKDVEASIVRIAQLGRAAGIHLVVATQSPRAEIVTGLIRANIDNRVALSVGKSQESRIIIDEGGAERLLGHGDMLFKLRGASSRRAQGVFTSEAEVQQVVEFIKEHRQAEYHDDILSAVAPASPAAGGGGGAGVDADDPLLWEAARIVVESNLGSTSGLQRRLKVGYSRAGRIMDMLEQKGVVGPPDGSKPREVLLDLQGLEELREADMAYGEV